MNHGEIGILQIGNARYGFRLLELCKDFDSTMILKGELLENMFLASNRRAKANELRDTARGGSQIKNVIFNDPATVVYWGDGTKTVVKCQEGDTYSKETGLALCIAKKYLGNKGNFNEVFKKWIPEETPEIKVGDAVRVVAPGENYTTYSTWVRENISDRKLAAKWRPKSAADVGVLGIVKHIAPHGHYENRTLAYVDKGDSCFIIGIPGLEKI